MHLKVNRRSRYLAAFTLAELLVASAASVFLASIIYMAGSEMLISFARNISINRSYSDARSALERIAQTLESAGYTPTLIDSDGLTPLSPLINPQTGAPNPAAGISFYRMNSAPQFAIPSGLSTDTSLKITLPTGVSSPLVGDLISIPLIGFQNLVTSVTASGTTATLSFGGSTIASGCKPALTSVVNFTPVSAKTSPPAPALPVTYTISYSCLQYTPVAFVAVNNQLRYYPRAATNAAAFNTASNYKVIANLVSSATGNQLLPFQFGPVTTPGAVPTTISITLCAEGPDYNKRNLGTANTFTQMQTSLGSRCPLLLNPS